MNLKERGTYRLAMAWAVIAACALAACLVVTIATQI